MTTIINWVLDLFSSLMSLILSPLFALFNGMNIPSIDSFASALTSFWDFIIGAVGYTRSALLLDTFEWNLLLTILSLRLLYKPTIAMFKYFAGWFQKLWPF